MISVGRRHWQVGGQKGNERRKFVLYPLLYFRIEGQPVAMSSALGHGTWLIGDPSPTPTILQVCLWPFKAWIVGLHFPVLKLYYFPSLICFLYLPTPPKLASSVNSSNYPFEHAVSLLLDFHWNNKLHIIQKSLTECTE